MVKYDILSNNRRSKLHAVVDCLFFFSLICVSYAVFRSPIHGRGLFCTRNIAAGEMVIEYSGMLVRSVLTDKRETYYESKVILVSDSLVVY